MDLLNKFFDTVLNPLVRLLFAAAVVYFIYGVFAYVIKGEGDADRTQGKSHILWGTIGIFIMVSVWGIIALIKNVLGA